MRCSAAATTPGPRRRGACADQSNQKGSTDRPNNVQRRTSTRRRRLVQFSPTVVSGADLTFATHPAAAREANVKSKAPLVWWFGNPLHSCRNLIKRIPEPNHTRMIDLLVSFESEVRSRARRRMKRTSDSGH